MAYLYLYFKQIYIPKIFIQTAMLWRRVSEIYKMGHKVPLFRLIRIKVILCNKAPFCDEGQTKLLRDSPNFDGNVGID